MPSLRAYAKAPNAAGTLTARKLMKVRTFGKKFQWWKRRAPRVAQEAEGVKGVWGGALLPIGNTKLRSKHLDVTVD